METLAVPVLHRGTSQTRVIEEEEATPPPSAAEAYVAARSGSIASFGRSVTSPVHQPGGRGQADQSEHASARGRGQADQSPHVSVSINGKDVSEA